MEESTWLPLSSLLRQEQIQKDKMNTNWTRSNPLRLFCLANKTRCDFVRWALRKISSQVSKRWASAGQPLSRIERMRMTSIVPDGRSVAINVLVIKIPKPSGWQSQENMFSRRKHKTREQFSLGKGLLSPEKGPFIGLHFSA